MHGHPTIIAGPRTYAPCVYLLRRIVTAACLDISELVCGMAPGVDTAGRAWAEATGTPWVPFPAPWDARTLDYPGRVIVRADGTHYHTGAGGWRNREMARYCQARGGQLLALWDGTSRGTGDMIAQARQHRLPLVIYWIHE